MIGLLWLAIPLHAIAKPKPKLAVAPLKGDSGNKVGAAVVDALAGKDYFVLGPNEVGREMKAARVSGKLDDKDTRKLTKQLGVVAVIDGRVVKAGGKRSLHLDIHRRGKPDTTVIVQFKSTDSDSFRERVHDEVLQKLGNEPSDDDGDERVAARQAEDEDARRKKREAEDEDRKRKLAEDEDRRARREAEDRKPRRGDDGPGEGRRKRAAADSDDDDDADDEPRARRRKGRRLDTDERPPHLLARVGVGASAGVRRLTYGTRGGFAQKPPRVGTFAGAGRVDGEVYPFALSDPDSQLAGLGVAGMYDKTFGLSIDVPNTAASAPINQSHYALGVRYRFGVGAASAVTAGLDYAHRQYIADRSGLMGVILDAPDVSYSAVAPGLAARVPVAPTITFVGSLTGMLMLKAGPIQQSNSYGPATVYGAELLAGVDIALATRIGVRVLAEYSQINLSFDGKGALSNNRDGDTTTQDIKSATDRSFGLAATLGVTY